MRIICNMQISSVVMFKPLSLKILHIYLLIFPNSGTDFTGFQPTIPKRLHGARNIGSTPHHLAVTLKQMQESYF